MGVGKKESGAGNNFSSALSEAERIIEAAEKRAESLLEEAELKLGDAKSEGYQEGFEQGRKDAVLQAVRLIEESPAVADALAAEAAKLAIAIADSIVAEHVQVVPETAKQIALAALQESVIGDSVTLSVNPDDENEIIKALSDIRRIAGGAAVSIEADTSLARGGCIVRTDFGEVDASIETLLSSISERLGVDK